MESAAASETGADGARPEPPCEANQMNARMKLSAQKTGVRTTVAAAALGLAASFCVGLAALGHGPAQAQPQAGAPPPGGGGQANVASELGFGLFQQRCLACHGNPAYERAPPPAALREMTPEHIFEALSPNGIMYPVVGKDLTETQRRLVSESVAGRLMGTAQSGDAARMPNRCASNPPMPAPGAGPAWNGWGAGLDNARFQSAKAAGLTAAEVPKLKLKWAFGYPGGTSAYGQPSVVSGRVFVGTDTGWVYSLDARTGCVYWSFQTKAGVRNAMTVGPISGHPGVEYAVFFGDVKANAYALDAQTGEQIWTRKVEDNFTDRVTAAPALYRGRLYVPISSWEEFSARALDFACCTSVGAVVALDADTGAEIWKTYVIPERPRIVGRNSNGIEQWAPAGASVWNTPTVDPRRNAIYIGTGDATTYPAAETSDAVMAISMTDGRILWSHQVHRNDSFLVGCNGGGRTETCPKVQGPDWDIPASPVLHRLPGGKDELIVGTKPGDILALDPDAKGAQLWRVNLNGAELAGDGPLPAGQLPNGVMWGFADDGARAYFGMTGGGVAALDLAAPATAWYAKLNGGTSPAGRVGHGAATTAIPGAVFVGGSDGRLYAVSTADGRTLWTFDTARSFDTVNKVEAHGGSIGAPGPTVAGGMVFVGSGYAVTRGSPGNVLLAFAAQ
jgi:polyvinyl alcohol dehydrogenase (cytochrome)